MTALLVWALAASVAAIVLAALLSDARAQLRMPELPPKPVKKVGGQRRKRDRKGPRR